MIYTHFFQAHNWVIKYGLGIYINHYSDGIQIYTVYEAHGADKPV